jgi:hypothetical protein
MLGVISDPVDERVEAAEFGVSTSEHVFGFGGKLVQRANRTTFVA